MTEAAATTAGDPDPGLAPSPPDPDRWGAIPDDDFAVVVAHARRALADVDDVHLGADVRRLRAIPASRLVRGKGRRRLLAALAAGGPFWVGTRTRIDRDPELVDRLRSVLDEPTVDRASTSPDPDLAARIGDLERSLQELRAQRDEARSERDEARRQRDGARGREASLRTERDRARAELADLRARLDTAEVSLASAAADLDAAVARETRRGDADRRGLEADLATARRELDDLRRARARATSASPVTPGRTGPRTSTTRRSGGRAGPSSHAGVDTVRPGRPSRLPRGTRLDTREGAAALVESVGRMIVDGYNVTRTHRADLDLAAQRDWLVNGLTAMASRTGVDVEVVFDAHLAGRPSGRRLTGVQVSYTHPGITADDEIVLAVEASDIDRPMVVVTDDRELRERLAPARVDLLPTASLVWLLG